MQKKHDKIKLMDKISKTDKFSTLEQRSVRRDEEA